MIEFETETVGTIDAVIAPDGSPARDGITLYGADWCSDTVRSKAFLEERGIAYTDVDVEQSAAANAWIAAQNGGERRLPTIVLGRGRPLLFEPSDAELEGALRQAGYLDRRGERAA